MTLPRILLTPDEEIVQTRRGPSAQLALDRHYAQAILDAGGLPLIAPYTDDDRALDALFDHADALVLTGGAFDVDPALFGEAPHPTLGPLKKERTRFERAVYERAVERSLPILGICGGMQLMNVLRNGTLWQDLPSQVPQALNHEQEAEKSKAGHDVTIRDGTQLSDIAGEARLGVNSTHHQAIRALGDGLAASATADDGIVEAFEDPSLPFYLGVQWHPEAMPHKSHQAIYRALVEAARS